MPTVTRPSGRAFDALRPISLETDVNKYAEGSCMARFGDTHVLCTASVDQKVPGWLKGQGRGWVTAEYGMLPRSTDQRTDREAARGKQSGRTQEIQRLIGRSLRAAVDLKALGEVQVKVDCDVIQADGGTRTAAITGGYVALCLALGHLVSIGHLKAVPVLSPVAAISCGLYRGQPVLDLDYAEDKDADADANFVLTAEGAIVEVQGTAEDRPFPRAAFDRLLDLAEAGVAALCSHQRRALGQADH